MSGVYSCSVISLFSVSLVVLRHYHLSLFIIHQLNINLQVPERYVTTMFFCHYHFDILCTTFTVSLFVLTLDTWDHRGVTLPKTTSCNLILYLGVLVSTRPSSLVRVTMGYFNTLRCFSICLLSGFIQA